MCFDQVLRVPLCRAAPPNSKRCCVVGAGGRHRLGLLAAKLRSPCDESPSSTKAHTSPAIQTNGLQTRVA